MKTCVLGFGLLTTLTLAALRLSGADALQRFC
jgi:hypothetical protein